jgi:hypothetical protein
MNTFSKLAVHKIKMQKSVAFPYTNNELAKKEVGKKTHSQ